MCPGPVQSIDWASRSVQLVELSIELKLLSCQVPTATGRNAKAFAEAGPQVFTTGHTAAQLVFVQPTQSRASLQANATPALRAATARYAQDPQAQFVGRCWGTKP